MTTPSNRTFGLHRPTQSNQPKAPSHDRWVPVGRTTSIAAAASPLDGPVPVAREVAERKFTTYCALHLGHPKNATPSKVTLTKHLFNILRQADETLVLQPFLQTDNVNSICHATHLVAHAKEFEHYFPETRYYQKRYRTKCRMSSSIPIDVIKNKVFVQLRSHDFWVNPTSIKCFETERCGFFLYAHPDYTFRHDILTTLSPIIGASFVDNQEFEYDIQPERLTIAGNQTVSEKVVMLRTIPRFNAQVQTLLSTLYSDDSNVNIGPLRKYVFVPMNLLGDADQDTMLGLLRSQRVFRQSVYHFICKNINKFDTKFEVPILSDDPPSDSSTTTSTPPAPEEGEITDEFPPPPPPTNQYVNRSLQSPPVAL